jgi:predicted ATPase
MPDDGGMPLGIELAAAWEELLSCASIAKEIDENLDFLTVSMGDLPERHRSMRAILDHSWKLLNPEQKQVLSRLSVFQGCFRLEAAKAVCGASLAILSSLRNKSLLHRVGPSFYELHALIRQYTALKLAEDSGEEERVNDEHAFYYSERLSQAEKTLKSSNQVDTLNEMAWKINNLRQAWQWMIGCL